MSFPSGNVVVTPFVGAYNENDGTVAPPQGLEFFEDVKGDYYDGLQNEDGEVPCSFDRNRPFTLSGWPS